ncbi:phage antirepressor [Lactobacillus iners]|uniref:phage antirepressor n=1 Tax=Lactobacillus iners TaxID=147802 RepID=UPI0001E9BDD8|nr:phage antirepressor [Lactobacillus iners]EFQ49093.1 BRO family, N-terminal domain protein [Lactobacillus iners LEAF 2052A-d]
MIDNKIQIFNFENNEVRTLNIDGKPYFVGKDIAAVLGYSNPQKALRAHVDEEDKTVNESFTVNGTKAVLINESGLYSLILSSKMPNAKKFKRWVTSEVLPAIVHKGVYMTDDVIEKVIKDPDFIIKLATELKEEKTKRLVAEQQVYELKPKATYYDLVLQNKSLLSVTQIAKDYGKSAKWLNEKLHELGMQYKQGSTWLLYQKYADKGYTQSTTHVIDECNAKLLTKWTQAGRLAIYQILKSKNILPLIERS